MATHRVLQHRHRLGGRDRIIVQGTAEALHDVRVVVRWSAVPFKVLEQVVRGLQLRLQHGDHVVARADAAGVAVCHMDAR